MTEPSPNPPRAFAQGVGTVFQFAGVTLFVVLFSICCLSSLFSKDWATHTELTRLSWMGYTAQRALSICMAVGVFLGMAVAGLGLGLQAQHRRAGVMAAGITAFGVCFWAFHLVFFLRIVGSLGLSLATFVLLITFAILLGFAIAAWRDLRRDPPPPGFELLPRDYKVPYSHLHADPPEVRLQRELEQRRQKLQVQQKELEMLEQKLRRKMKPGGE